MSTIYLKDEITARLKQTATRQRRSVSTVIQIMLDYEDQRFFIEKENQEKLKKSEVKR